MVYIALLRGINVGGNNKINMKELKSTFERVGLGNVVTYINTGNIIFTDDSRTAPEISALLEEAIASDFGLSIKVMVRTIEQIGAIMAALPELWTNDGEMKSDVLYLWESTVNPSWKD
jgi:uncharacterized protein (DUF1697 family)